MANSISRRADHPRRARTWRTWLLVGVAAAAVGVGGAAVSRSSAFHARGIEITGTDRLSRADVASTAGVSRVTNVLWLEEGEAERRLTADPWIAHAEVRVSLPWTITIEIVERAPIAVATDGVREVLVATDGTFLGPASRSDRALPRIQLPATRADDGPRPSPEGAAEAVGALSPAVRAMVTRVTILGDGSLEIRLLGGVRVRYGTASDPERKAATLEGVLAWADAEGERVTSISVSAPGLPAVRLAA